MDFVLEVGMEEAPARFLPRALEQLGGRAGRALQDARLGWSSLSTLGTPRRLVLLVEGLPERQEPRVVKARGPARRVAFDEHGNPTRAALGFAAAQGVGLEELIVEDTPGGEYVFACRQEEGSPTLEVLATIVPQILADLEFPRMMRWGSGEYRFVRPVRWVLALLDDLVVPFSFAGVHSGRTMRGHRALHPAPVEVAHARGYLEAAAAAGVVPDPTLRRQRIREQVERAATHLGGRPLEDEELAEEVTFLVEHPTAVGGRFQAEYLSLPREVIITVLRHHQRFFAVGADDRQRLLPAFIGVRDGGVEGIETVRSGYERVVQARLADARFFYAEDLKVPLERWGESLAGMGFLEDMGTLQDKVARMEMLAGFLAYSFGLDEQLTGVCRRAARLSKADRATHMVRELPELEGIMGREYALRSGEEGPVAEAIREHYLPRFAQDELPSSLAGMVVSLADRLDTLVGAFSAGLEPSGSQDPYGLRRAAYGLVRILWAAGLRLSLGWAIEESQATYRQVLGRADLADGEQAERVKESLLEFLRQRVRNLFGEQGIRPDFIDAVVGCTDDVSDGWNRALALQEAKDFPEFTDALAAFRRAATLAERAEGDAVEPALLREAPERQLWEAFLACSPAARAHAGAGDWRRFLATVATLRPAVDTFLDRVLVMAPEEPLRRNRLALLRRLADLFGLLGDLSRVLVV
ncbi:MAG: glycine--tRNA ligase subunit beta [Bacillota bacterium]|nr:glycine--tRNA ligase subunit beta [Bacillota bacterium]